MSETTTEPQGWGFPSRARKCHYIREGLSLCGKYAWFSQHNDRLEPDTGTPSRDDCAACRRKLDAARAGEEGS